MTPSRTRSRTGPRSPPPAPSDTQQDTATRLPSLSDAEEGSSSSSEPSDTEPRSAVASQGSKEEKTSRFRGVTLSGSSEDTKWWTAQLHKHRRKIRVGYSYASEEAAARAYDRACIAINGRGTRTNFPLIAYPEETERKREGADLDDFLELLRTDVNPEGVPGVPHMDGWVPPTAALWSRMQDGRARAPHPRIKGPSCGACASCRQPWLHQACTGRPEEQSLRKRRLHAPAPTAESDAGAAPETPSSLEPELQAAGDGAQDCNRAMLPVRELRDVQAMERALFEAQHGAARIAAEAAGPLYLHARPPPPPLVRPARVSYAALLSRFRQDAAADRMSSFHDDPADSDSAPSGSAELSGLASHAAQRGRRKHAECRVCRSVEHDTQRCPVVWLAGYAGTEADAGPMHAAHGSAEQHQPEECPWLVRLPESIKNNMDAMQQYAADIANEHAFGYNSRLVKRSFSPEALLAAALVVDETMQAAAVDH